MRTLTLRARVSVIVLALATFSSMMTSSSAVHPADPGSGPMEAVPLAPPSPGLPASPKPKPAELEEKSSSERTKARASRSKPKKPKKRKLTRRQRVGFKTPVEGFVTSTFGRRPSGMHHGLDIACPWGRKIKTAKKGRVVYVNKRHSVYGRTIVIAHPGGYTTLYGHNSRIGVSVGKKVKDGQTIARCGNSGRSTGSHLHFELRKHGRFLDPQKYLTD